MTRQVVILVPNWSGGIDRLFEDIGRYGPREFGIRTFNTHGRSLAGLSFLPFRLVYYSSALFYSLLLPFRLAWFAVLCAGGKVDLCHVNLSTGASTIRKALFANICRLFGVPYVVHLHGGDYRRFYARLRWPLQGLARRLYLHADRVLVLGSVWRDYVTEEIGVDPDDVVVLPNAVSGPLSDTWQDKADTPAILFLGRLTNEKGIPELVEALAAPQVASLPWTAVLAGDGELAKYRSRVDELGLADRVRLPGWVDADTVSGLLERSAIFVLPSHFENLPLSMLEAMAYGLCCVVTPVGSVVDVIEDGANGLIVPVGDSAALAAALQSILRDAGLRQRLGAKARDDFLAAYDYREYRRKLEQIYSSVLTPAP